MLVTPQTHPNIVKAFQEVAEDSGRIASPVQDLPSVWDPHLAGIEEALGKLSRVERAPECEPLPAHVKPDVYRDSEFYNFCCGEGGEQLKIASRSYELRLAHILLNEFFEDFDRTGAENPMDPEELVK